MNFFANKSRLPVMDFYPSWDSQVHKNLLITWKIPCSLKYHLHRLSILNVLCTGNEFQQSFAFAFRIFFSWLWLFVVFAFWPQSGLLALVLCHTSRGPFWNELVLRKTSLLGERWSNSLELFLFCVYIYDSEYNIRLTFIIMLFFLFKISDTKLPSDNSCSLVLSKSNAQIQHLINICLPRAFIVKSIPHCREHWLLHAPVRPTHLPGISNHCSTPWKTDASVQS